MVSDAVAPSGCAEGYDCEGRERQPLAKFQRAKCLQTFFNPSGAWQLEGKSKKQPPLEDQKDDKADAKEAPEQD